MHQILQKARKVNAEHAILFTGKNGSFPPDKIQGGLLCTGSMPLVFNNW